jgi:hypothetical protein
MVSKKEDKQNWTFISTDNEGKVLVNFIDKKGFFFWASNNIIVDPKKSVDGQKFPSISCKFSNPNYG